MRISICALVVASCVWALHADLSSPLLVAGSGRAMLLDRTGRVAWEKKDCGNIHRVWLHHGKVYWSNGALYETDIPTGETRLYYKPCEKEGVYGFEVLANGNVVVAENGTDYITELAADTAKPIVRFRGDPSVAGTPAPNGHHHYRMIRKTPQGTYLVCCSGANLVREYDATGKLVWEQKTPGLAFDCLRRANGNTLVSHLNAVSEFTPDHAVVWSFACSDAPERKLANLCGIQEMPNGNLVIGTYANGGKDRTKTTALEVTRAKKVVWYYNGEDRSMMTAFRIDDWRWPVGFLTPSAAEEAQMNAQIDAWKARVKVPSQPHRVLVVARAFGYSHHEALAYGTRAVAKAGEMSCAWESVCTADVRCLTNAAYLAQFDALVLNNTTFIAAKKYPGISRVLTSYVRAGKGLALIHSAVDSFYDDTQIQAMNGGLFCGHPWMAGGTWRFCNERQNDPVNASFAQYGSLFTFSDEIYMQKTPPFARANCRVLVSLDMTHDATRKAAEQWGANPKLKTMPLRADGDYAVAWTKDYGKGRVFYTSFGHDRRAFLDARLGHVLAGIWYVIGE